MTSLTTTHLETGSAQLLCAVRHRVAVITLNRPDAKNALSDELTPALRRMIAHCADTPAIGAVLITGTGPAFCAGGDLKGMGSASPAVLPFDQRLAQLRVRQRTLTSALLGLRKPTLAALPGPAAGAGLAIALACDIRLAAESAFITTGYAQVALSGDYGISSLLTRIAGTARARELMFTSRRVDAATSQSMGLVNRVVPDAQLQDEAFKLARQLANGSAQALSSIKDNLDDALSVDFETSMDREAERLLRSMEHPDHSEAVQAFIDRRAPQFHPESIQGQTS